jgi:Protein of unknown function (DUF2793)
MPSTQEPRGGLYYGWTAGESGWDVQVDANWGRVGAIMQIGVTDRDLNVAPVSPAVGDTYIVGPVPTAAWLSKAGQIAIFRTGDIWEFYDPKMGWLAYIADEEVLAVYKTSGSPGWSAGLAM